MICPRCQNQLPDNSVACNICGLQFQYQQQPQQQPTYQQPQPQMQYRQPQQVYQQPQQPVQPKPKKNLKPLWITLGSVAGAILIIFIIATLISYRPQEIDYGNAFQFEQALNNGENVNGKIVRFKVKDFKYSILGNNLWAGQHLNFFGKTKARKGDVVTVKIKKVTNIGDSYMIKYKVVKNGVVTKNTIGTVIEEDD